MDPPTLEYLNSLLRHAKQGSSEALGELFETFRDILRALAHRLRRKAFLSKFGDSDLVQLAFMTAHRKFAQFSGEDAAELQYWLERIDGRTTANELRLLRRVKRDAARERPMAAASGATALNDESLLDWLCSSETREAVRTVLRRLPKVYCRALEFRHLERLTESEIARRLHSTEDDVRRILTGGRRMFRSEWQAVRKSARIGRG